jgi:hypothetical protein
MTRGSSTLRIVTTALFVLVGVIAYLVSALVDSGIAKALLQSLGTFLIAAVAIGYAYEYFLSDEVENRMARKLDEILERRIDRELLESSKYGFSGFATTAPRKAFNNLEEGDELLWLDTYSPDLPLFRDKIQAAVKKGAHLRMLVIDPEAATAHMRADEIADDGYGDTHFCGAAREFLSALVEVAEKLGDEKGRIEVRAYKDLPGVPMYVHLRNKRPIAGVTGFFLSAPSFDEAHLCWRSADNGMLTSFVDHFEHKWRRSPPHVD